MNLLVKFPNTSTCICMPSVHCKMDRVPKYMYTCTCRYSKNLTISWYLIYKYVLSKLQTISFIDNATCTICKPRPLVTHPTFQVISSL